MTSTAAQITAMKNETAFAQSKQERTVGMQNDSNTFLTLMLKQMEIQVQLNLKQEIISK